MRTAPHRKGSESGGHVSSRYRSAPSRIAAILQHTPKLGMLSGDVILGALIALGVLFIALVWYDGTPRYNPELASEAESLMMARDVLAKSAALNWSKEIPVEVWDGVTVDLETWRVTGLRLRDSGLTGMIPQELGTLSDLTYLDLRGNQLTGTIPSELGKLAELKTLYLHDNRLNGTMPAELGDLSNLQRLWLSNNQLTGPIPPELGNLRNLVNWRFGRNRLTGCVPKGLVAVEDNDFVRLGLEICEGSSNSSTDRER